MGTMRTIFGAVAAVLLVALMGCVELTGQRITLNYDEANDRLVLFLNYDGIHDNEGKGDEKGVDQLREFLLQGDVMFLDWRGHLEWKKFRRKAQDQTARPAERELARMTVTTIKTEAVGHYRAPDGRVGALQRIVIPEASKYVRQVNAALTEAILAKADRKDGFADLRKTSPRTLALVEAAARSGHRWVALDGSAIRISFPVHSREWAQAKARFLEEFLEGFTKASKRNSGDELKPNSFIQLLVAGPLSIVERDGYVEITYGDGKPRTSRVLMYGNYNQLMEGAVTTQVPTRLDAAIAARLLGDGVSAAPNALDEFLRWGPPEDKVRALLAVAKSGDAGERAAANAWLARFAVRWNADEGYPTAPTNSADHDAWMAQWAKWYGRMLAFPVKGE